MVEQEQSATYPALCQRHITIKSPLGPFFCRSVCGLAIVFLRLGVLTFVVFRSLGNTQFAACQTSVLSLSYITVHLSIVTPATIVMNDSQYEECVSTYNRFSN
jgi:hypothetical protein